MDDLSVALPRQHQPSKLKGQARLTRDVAGRENRVGPDNAARKAVRAIEIPAAP